MSDKTFRSELIELIDKYEIGFISSTPSPVMAEFIEQIISALNLFSAQKENAQAKYIEVMESQLAEYREKLEIKMV